MTFWNDKVFNFQTIKFTIMSKKDNAMSIDTINDQLHNQMVTGEVMSISREAAFDFFETANDQSFQTLGGGEYLNWDNMNEGKFVFIFTGTTTWVDNSPQGRGQLVTAVKLEDREGKEWICAARTLVDSLSLISVVPCMVRVEYKGKKKARSGNNYFDLKVQAGRGSLVKTNEQDNFQL
jgi:hypothetical protein